MDVHGEDNMEVSSRRGGPRRRAGCGGDACYCDEPGAFNCACCDGYHCDSDFRACVSPRRRSSRVEENHDSANVSDPEAADVFIDESEADTWADFSSSSRSRGRRRCPQTGSACYSQDDCCKGWYCDQPPEENGEVWLGHCKEIYFGEEHAVLDGEEKLV